jgi:hypothetical protein
MKRSVFAAVVAVLVLSGVTVEHGSITGVFSFDAKTHIGVKGATAKTAEAKAAGKPGATGPDLLHAGDQVKVTYSYTASTNKMTVSDITVTESLAKK